MTFTVWISEFCSDHVKLQTIYEILEANRLADLIIIIKTLITPRRSREIDRNREHNYDEHGKRHGICRGWWENGLLLMLEDNYEHGKRHGISRGWHKNGQIWYESNYEHGKQHGICRGWWDNGKLSYESNYEHGRLIN